MDFGLKEYVNSYLDIHKVAFDLGIINEFQYMNHSDIMLTCIDSQNHKNGDHKKSAKIYTTSQKYWCFNCKHLLDSVSLYAKINNVREENAIEDLIKLYNLKLLEEDIKKIEEKRENKLKQVSLLKSIYF